MSEILCPYCWNPAQLVDGGVIYPHREDLYAKWFWRCHPCNAYVGCHPGTQNPLGRLADPELRRAKMAAHAAFDPLWKNGAMSRKEAYAWLAQALNLSPDDCHMGMFDLNGCKRVVEACLLREVPKVLENPDWSAVIRECQARIEEYQEGTNTDSNLPHAIYEAAMSAVFGPKVWDWIRIKY